MARTESDICLIGAGVSGLSSALALLQAGFPVRVYGADPPHRATSGAAGALWGAHLVGQDKRIAGWALATLDRFRALAADPAAGVRELTGLAAFLAEEPRVPDFVTGLTGVARADPATLPPGYVDGLRYLAPVIDMPAYLNYLMEQVLGHGGTIQLGPRRASLAETAATEGATIIVNCTGIGAREFVPDDTLIPVRGQVVIVTNPGIEEFFVGERERPDEITYLFPHGGIVLLGGTEQRGNASLRPDQDTAIRIQQACAEVEPALASAKVLAHRVGLRPVRPSVRLETEHLADGRTVVHNYGHGGAGVTLSWGCAQTVAQIVAETLG
jgi:D-amino-acid oxidase